MEIQGYSPLPQPDNVFTLEAYQAFLITYGRIRRARWDDAHSKEERESFSQQGDIMGKEYYQRLPVYLLARCPLCGGRVWEGIDTFSLNGIGWKQPHGFGWHSGGWNQLEGKYLYSFAAECDHAKLMLYSINMNGLQPDDVSGSFPLGPERPFVLQGWEHSKVVMHALPIGRSDDLTLIPRYIVYFTTYFTEYERALDMGLGPRDVSDGGRVFTYREADYDLLPRVAKGQLFWLDTDSPELPLKNSPVEAFPYAVTEGITEATWLKDGKLEPWRPWERKQAREKAAREQREAERQQRGSLFTRLFRAFFDPKNE